jgi:hypothetical protein
MGDRLFIQTGVTPPRGIMADVRVSKRLGKRGEGTTLLITGRPYRRVYEDSEGLWIKWYGSKCRVFLAFDSEWRKK